MARMARKVDINSLPDEILQNIVEQLAGTLEYNEDRRGYTRSLLGNASLRGLRLLNRRFSRIAGLELYRAPSAMFSLSRRSQQMCLSGDHLHILFHPMIQDAARFLSLAGASAFFAGTLETQFFKLTSLTLVFTNDSRRASSMHECETRSLTVLRDALQAVPLRELYLHLGARVCSSNSHHFQTLSLAAGHPTLRHLHIDPAPELWSDETDSLIPDSKKVTRIVSLRLGRFYKENLEVVQNSLGILPNLSELSIDTRCDAVTGIGALMALTVDSRHTISSFKIQMLNLHLGLWQALAAFPNLRDLSVQSVIEEVSVELGEYILPSLENIIVDRRWTLSIGSIFLEQARHRHLLPSLTSVEIIFGDRAFNSWRAEEEEMNIFLVEYDKLAATDTGIEIRPTDVREVVALRLEKLRNRNLGILGKGHGNMGDAPASLPSS
jgi:hypothetical protein